MIGFKTTFAALLTALLFAPAEADIIYVTQGGSGNGSSWGNSASLQYALANANAGDDIWVAAGRYKPGALVQDVFVIPEGVDVYGGLHGDESPSFNLDNRDFVTDETFLDGDIDNDDELDDGNSNTLVLMSGYDEHSNRFDGFTVMMSYGTLDVSIDDMGGGAVDVLFNDDSVTVTIANCVFHDNFNRAGGGVVSLNSHLNIEDCTFYDNHADDYGGGVIAVGAVINNSTVADWHLNVTDCTFTNNMASGLDAFLPEHGGALVILSMASATVTNCDFVDNFAGKYGGAVGIWSSADPAHQPDVTFTDCNFIENSIENSDPNFPDFRARGGAVWIENADVSFSVCDFDDNQSDGGGGAIWVNAEEQDSVTQTASLSLDDCRFRRNVMTDLDEFNGPSGGGAVFLGGLHEFSGFDPDGDITCTITDCQFIGNCAPKGGALYSRSAKTVDIRDCTFVDNMAAKIEGDGGEGGAIVHDDELVRTGNQMRIARCRFVENTAQSAGGAIANCMGALTTAANCYFVGNIAYEGGGATVNEEDTASSVGDTRLDLHNCLIAGNSASNGSNNLDVGGACLNEDKGLSDVIHCTIFANHAGYKYGGLVCSDSNNPVVSRMQVYNCISWANTDLDTGTGTREAQVEYLNSTHVSGDTDQNVIDGLDTYAFSGGDNKDDDPVFLDPASTTIQWDAVSYDENTGMSTFSCYDADAAEPGMVFQPKASVKTMLLIVSVDTGADEIVCWGWWSSFQPTLPVTGKLVDLRIDDTNSSAIDYCENDHLPPDTCDVDDMNGTAEALPIDLYGGDRTQGSYPDSGVHEIQD